MKKRFLSIFLCVILMFSAISFTVNGAEAAEYYEFEYIKSDVATGDGYIVVEFSGEKFTLSEERESVQIPKGETVNVTIKAELGSSITALDYDGGPMSFGDPAQELNMTIKNFATDHSLKVTYMKQSFNCTVSSFGNGSVKIVDPATNGMLAQVPMGENFMFYAEAQEGNEIVSITVNGEAVDLTKYGQTDVIRITKFQMEVPQITGTTDVIVVFSSVSNKGKFGDVNSDSKVNVVDATLIQKAVAGLVSFDVNQSHYGDVDGDTRITVKDATAIQKHTAGIISSFPVENK